MIYYSIISYTILSPIIQLPPSTTFSPTTRMMMKKMCPEGPRVISALRPPPLRPLQKVGKSIVRPQWADLTISDQSENLLSDPYSEECVKNGADGILPAGARKLCTRSVLIF